MAREYGTSVETIASPEKVWRVWSDMSTWGEWNPNVSTMDWEGGFHSPHVDMSDHTRQTFSGEAVVSTEVPYSRAIAQVLFFFRQTARQRTAHGAAR